MAAPSRHPPTRVKKMVPIISKNIGTFKAVRSRPIERLRAIPIENIAIVRYQDLVFSNVSIIYIKGLKLRNRSSCLKRREGAPGATREEHLDFRSPPPGWTGQGKINSKNLSRQCRAGP